MAYLASRYYRIKRITFLFLNRSLFYIWYSVISRSLVCHAMSNNSLIKKLQCLFRFDVTQILNGLVSLAINYPYNMLNYKVISMSLMEI